MKVVQLINCLKRILILKMYKRLKNEYNNKGYNQNEQVRFDYILLNLIKILALYT